MRRILALFVIVSVAFGLVAMHTVTPTHANDNARITVYPASGTQDDTFAFTGSDFDPGEQLAVVYQDPSGTQYTYYQSDGVTPDVITADDSGNWVVSVHPRTDFSGTYAGTWTIAFCSVQSGNCWSGTIDISA